MIYLYSIYIHQPFSKPWVFLQLYIIYFPSFKLAVKTSGESGPYVIASLRPSPRNNIVRRTERAGKTK